MKQDKAVKAASYVAGFFVIAAALLLVIFLMLTLAGLLHPRQERLVIQTQSFSKLYDGTPLSGGSPEITYGQLHAGHTLQVLKIPGSSQVGEYTNAPEIQIQDETGADVTEQYHIDWDHGTIAIQARQITLTSPDRSKVYDGEPLTAEAVRLSGGTLAPGHRLSAEAGDSILLPGTQPIHPVYRILSESGADVTDQYEVFEDVGDLTVLPIDIALTTQSASKPYDGRSLSAEGWTHTGGTLLEDHTIEMDVTTTLTDVGTVPNEGTARILDENGKDVTALYQIHYRYGTLEIQAIALYIPP